MPFPANWTAGECCRGSWPALHRSSRSILRLLALGCEHGGACPAAHHRGQIVMAARALGERLPSRVTDGLWQWTTRRAEAG